MGGFNAYPAEIEGALLRHPGVAQAAVIGVPDDRMGEVGAAFVVARPGADAGTLADELATWSRDQMANYKVPRHVDVVDALPVNASGKVLKTELRERFASAQPRSSTQRDSEGSLMRGIVYTGEDAEVTDKLGIADPGPTEVKIKIVAAGVCHSDLSVLDGTIPWKAPSVLGHEGAGIVDSVGSSVRSVKPGDHVVVATLASCGTCRACNTGHPTMCIRSLGNVSTPFTFDGEPASNFAAASVFAEYTIVQEVQAVPISKDVPFTSACLIGCGVLTGVGSVLNRAKVAPGETSAVFGVGGVGLNVIQALRLSAASRIVAVDTMASKEDLAMQFGATHFIDASKADAVEEIKKIVPHGPKSMARALGPGGVTWAFDCVGHPAVLRNAIDALDWGGTAVAIGVPPRGSEVSVDINNLAYVDRGLIGCRYGALATAPRHPPHGGALSERQAHARRARHRGPASRGFPGDRAGHARRQAGARGAHAVGAARRGAHAVGADSRKVVMPDVMARPAWACHAGVTSNAASVALRMLPHSISTLGTVDRLSPARSSLCRDAVGPVVGAHRHRRLRPERGCVRRRRVLATAPRRRR